MTVPGPVPRDGLTSRSSAWPQCGSDTAGNCPTPRRASRRMGHLRLQHIAHPVPLGTPLRLIVTPSWLPVAYAKTDERDTALAMVALDPKLDRPG